MAKILYLLGFFIKSLIQRVCSREAPHDLYCDHVTDGNTADTTAETEGEQPGKLPIVLALIPTLCRSKWFQFNIIRQSC